MSRLAQQITQKPVRLFLALFLVVALLDVLFGESTFRHFVPAFGGLDEKFFSTLWFCGAVALIATAIVIIAASKKLALSLPWILGAAAAILLCTATVYDNLTSGLYKGYRNFSSSIYHPIRHTVPYYFPFQSPREFDYMLFTSSPVFLKASAVIVVPMLAGYVVMYGKNNTNR